MLRKTNEELAINIADLLDNGFSTKTEFAEGVLDIYNHLETGEFLYVTEILENEIEAREGENTEDLEDMLIELAYQQAEWIRHLPNC